MNKSIIRAIFGIIIAFCAASCATTTRETSAPTQAPATTAAPSTTAGAAQPHGYMIANYTINDQETFQKYMEAAGSLAPKYNGKVIIYDVTTRTLEGNPKSVIAVAEFPSLAEAERFYNSPEYTAARKFRIASTEGWVLLTSSVPAQQ
jgi:uncharacterized protein (DUF1330 family)